jgi:hypothetical protein
VKKEKKEKIKKEDIQMGGRCRGMVREAKGCGGIFFFIKMCDQQKKIQNTRIHP